MAEEQLYPCATPGCVNMRTKDQGGTIFTVCDSCWDEAYKPSHMKTCSEIIPFKCCACGKNCCEKHGIPLGEEHQGKWKIEGPGSKRCTFCADGSR